MQRELAGWRICGTDRDLLSDCSLIVATYNRPREIVDLLDLIEGQSAIPAEVLIVDASASEEVEHTARVWTTGRSLRFDVVYVRSPRGLTRQRNVGIDISQGTFLFFLDDDARPWPGYFAHLRRALIEDPEAGAVGGTIINEIDKPIPRRWRVRLGLGLVPRTPPLVFNGAGTSTPKGLLKPFQGVRSVDIIAGGASAFRRRIFDDMRFSEFFEGYSYGEDVEMSLRVKSRWRVLMSGDAWVTHQPAPDGRPPSFARGVMEVRNRVLIWNRYAPHTAANRARLYLDFLFLFLMDSAWFLARPWRIRFLAHGCGLLWSALRCTLRPPAYAEPPARRTYLLRADAAEVADAVPVDRHQ